MQTIKNTYSILLSKAKAEPRLVGALAAGAALGLVAIGRLVAASRCTWPIEGKVVLITGASSGIGKALALELVRRGASYADSIVATSNLSLIGNFWS
jgi:NADPH:quinone reductase-like Zn-dependent oxidoreductase